MTRLLRAAALISVGALALPNVSDGADGPAASVRGRHASPASAPANAWPQDPPLPPSLAPVVSLDGLSLARRDPAPKLRDAPIGDWQQHGACRDHDPELFFPDHSDHAALALAVTICAACPVRVDCLGFAVEHEPTHGVWGGTTPDQRQRMRRRRVAV